MQKNNIIKYKIIKKQIVEHWADRPIGRYVDSWCCSKSKK